MKKIGLFVKPDERSENFKNDYCNIGSVEFFDVSASDKIPDAVACFGGDGTILRAVNYCAENDVPLISVNSGTLGFLSAFGPDDKDAFQKTILQDALYFDNIKLFQANIEDSNFSTISNFLFLNEVVVQRKVSESFTNGAVSIKLFVNGKICQEFVGDGVIVSSPFGSTAYSLSAGGAILSPDIPALIVTPICAHSHAYPIVLPDNSTVKIELGDKSHDCIACVDGQKSLALKKNQSVVVKLSDRSLKILRGKYDFYSRLNEKILKWGKHNV